MAMMVKSPYSGRPVKVRDQDIGRAIRDEAGRVFYVVPRSEDAGYYAARTRQGSAKEEQAYLALEAQPALEAAAGSAAGEQPVHDATGKWRGPGAAVWVVLVIFLILLGCVCYWWYAAGQRGRNIPATQPLNQPTVQPMSRERPARQAAGISLWNPSFRFAADRREEVSQVVLLYDKWGEVEAAACPSRVDLSIVYLKT